MNVEKVKRWQWVTLGLLVGLALGYAHTSLSSGDLFSSPATISHGDFEAAVTAAPVPDQRGRLHPVARDITVRPRGDYHQVTLRRLESVADHLRNVKDPGAADGVDPHARQYYPYTLNARIPFRKSGPPGNTVVDYLAELKQSHGVKYRVAWWSNPSVALTLWAAGCTVLIGGVWPTALRMMVGAGLGRPPEPEKPAAAGYAEPEAEKPAQVDIPLPDEPEPIAPVAPVVAPPVAPAAAVRELTTEEVAAPAAAPAEDKEYEGEFYPVARKVRRDKAKA